MRTEDSGKEGGHEEPRETTRDHEEEAGTPLGKASGWDAKTAMGTQPFIRETKAETPACGARPRLRTLTMVRSIVCR